MNKQIIIVYILLLSFCSFAGVVQVVPLSGGGGSITNLSGLTFSNVVLTNSTFYGNATGTFYGNIIPTNNNFITTNNIYTYLTNVVVSPFLSDSYTIVSSPTYNVNFSSANTIHLDINNSTTFTESGWPNSDTNFNDFKVLIINNTSSSSVGINLPSWNWTSGEGFIPAPTNLNGGTSISIYLNRYTNYSAVLTVANPTYFITPAFNSQFGTPVYNNSSVISFLTNVCLLPPMSTNTVVSYVNTNTYLWVANSDSYVPPFPQWTLYLANGFYRYYIHNEMYSVTNSSVASLATVIGAVNTMITNLVANNLYTNMYALYPFIGFYSSCTSTNADRYNLVSTNFTLSFDGFLTNPVSHGSWGISNTTSYASANTFFNPFTQGTGTNMSFGGWNTYSTTNNGVYYLVADDGSSEASFQVTTSIGLQSTNQLRVADNSPKASIILSTNSILKTNDLWFAATRLNGTVTYQYDTLNNSYSVTNAITVPHLSISIDSADNNSKPNSMGTVFIATAVTTNQLNTIRTILQTFNTTLGR